MLRRPFFSVLPENSAASGGHIFSLLREKIWKKRALERFFIALSRPKAVSFCFTFYRYTVCSPNALRAAHSILYTEMSRRGKYLTYETP